MRPAWIPKWADVNGHRHVSSYQFLAQKFSCRTAPFAGNPSAPQTSWASAARQSPLARPARGPADARRLSVGLSRSIPRRTVSGRRFARFGGGGGLQRRRERLMASVTVRDAKLRSPGGAMAPATEDRRTASVHQPRERLGETGFRSAARQGSRQVSHDSSLSVRWHRRPGAILLLDRRTGSKQNVRWSSRCDFVTIPPNLSFPQETSHAFGSM